MHPFLIAAFSALLALFLTLVQPEMGHARALRIGAVVALLAVGAGWLWPLHMAEILVVAVAVTLLWLFGSALLWPIRFIGRLLRGT